MKVFQYFFTLVNQLPCGIVFQMSMSATLQVRVMQTPYVTTFLALSLAPVTLATLVMGSTAQVRNA